MHTSHTMGQFIRLEDGVVGRSTEVALRLACHVPQRVQHVVWDVSPQIAGESEIVVITHRLFPWRDSFRQPRSNTLNTL